MTTELKPCPFDGGKALQGSGQDGVHYVRCRRCRCQTALYVSKDDAITAWNTRKGTS